MAHETLSPWAPHTPKNSFSKRQRAHYIKFTGSFTTRRQAHFFPSNLCPKTETIFFFLVFFLFSLSKNCRTFPTAISPIEVCCKRVGQREMYHCYNNKVRIRCNLLGSLSIAKYILHNECNEYEFCSFSLAGFWKRKSIFVFSIFIRREC